MAERIMHVDEEYVYADKEFFDTLKGEEKATFVQLLSGILIAGEGYTDEEFWMAHKERMGRKDK